MREVAGGGGCGFEGERHFVCFLRVKDLFKCHVAVVGGEGDCGLKVGE